MERKETQNQVKDLLKRGDSYFLNKLCSSDPYALSYLITLAIKQQETINHIKNIISED